MKKLVLLSSIVCLFSCKHYQDKGYLSSISDLPSFDILLMDSATVLQAKEIPVGKPIIILYFRPDCVHCNTETKALINQIEMLKNMRIYFLASAALEDIKEFSTYYHLEKFPNITVGNDYKHTFTKIFKPKTLPYIALYNSEKQLVKIYDSEVPVNTLIAAIYR